LLVILREIGQILLKWTYQLFIRNVFLSYSWKIIGYITNDLSNMNPGYIFVSNYQNHKFHDYKSFLTLIIDISTLWDKFVIVIAVNGILLLNLGQIRRWLNNYTDRLLYLMAAIEILARSPSWNIELTYIQLQNISC